MGFLSGRMSFERFEVSGRPLKAPGPAQLEALARLAIRDSSTPAAESAAVGFIAGRHLFDRDFQLEKNIIDGAVLAALRVDVSRVPGPLRKAWLEIELAALAAESPTGRVSRTERKEAQEAVQARCEEELAEGKFRRMSQTPFLWDAPNRLCYVASTSSGVQEHLRGLFHEAFGLSLKPLTAGRAGEKLAAELEAQAAWDRIAPSSFHGGELPQSPEWLEGSPVPADFLGNEFLMWLWWWFERQSEHLDLPDDSQVTGMIAKSLAMQCPVGQTGRDTLSAEAPGKTPEAFQAAKSGKWLRRAGLVLVRGEDQFQFALQGERLGVGGLALESATGADAPSHPAERIGQLRRFSETLDLLYRAFITRRLSRGWNAEVKQIREWLE
ncbi:MAG: hypothetical protein ACK5HA_01580 [Planctomycetaceae bacterium]|jgi:hypothetical protein